MSRAVAPDDDESASAARAVGNGRTFAKSTAAKDAFVLKVVLAVGIVGWIGFLISTGYSVFQHTRPLPPPVTVVVDRMTGEWMSVYGRFDDSVVPKVEKMDLKNAADFVCAYERYSFYLLSNDYRKVASMSTPEVFAPYRARYSGPEAMQAKVGLKEEHVCTIIRRQPSSTTRPGRDGEIYVTFDKEIHSTQGAATTKRRYVATVRFEYRPESIKRVEDQAENPHGFVTISYRTDADLEASPPAVAAKVP